MAVVAAKQVRRKKHARRMFPRGIWLNTRGMVMKRSPGPAEGSIPKENTAGKMASPASMETRVSDAATLPAVWIRLLSSVK